MKEASLLDMLLFLVANQLSEKLITEREKLRADLEEAGIPLKKLIKIAGWLKYLLQDISMQSPSGKKAMRVFLEEEREKINPAARGCILFLEQTGVLNPVKREWLIDHAMNLEVEEVGINELQQLLSIVLFQEYEQVNLFRQDTKSLIMTNPQVMH